MPSTYCFMYQSGFDSVEEEGMYMIFMNKKEIPKQVIDNLHDLVVVDEDAGNDFFDKYMNDPDYNMDDVKVLKHAHQTFVEMISNADPVNMIPHNAACSKVIRIQFRPTGDRHGYADNSKMLYRLMLQILKDKVNMKKNKKQRKI